MSHKIRFGDKTAIAYIIDKEPFMRLVRKYRWDVSDVPNRVPNVPNSKHKTKQVALTEAEMKSEENQVSGENGEVYWYDFCFACRKWRLCKKGADNKPYCKECAEQLFGGW